MNLFGNLSEITNFPCGELLNQNFAFTYVVHNFSALGSTSPNTATKEVNEPPIKFEDIVDATTYDKMRPPRPGGELLCNGPI